MKEHNQTIFLFNSKTINGCRKKFYNKCQNERKALKSNFFVYAFDMH